MAKSYTTLRDTIRLARSRYVETDVLLIFSRSETARIDTPQYPMLG
jgi:hypothetical protein